MSRHTKLMVYDSFCALPPLKKFFYAAHPLGHNLNTTKSFTSVVLYQG